MRVLKLERRILPISTIAFSTLPYSALLSSNSASSLNDFLLKQISWGCKSNESTSEGRQKSLISRSSNPVHHNTIVTPFRLFQIYVSRVKLENGKMRFENERNNLTGQYSAFRCEWNVYSFFFLIIFKSLQILIGYDWRDQGYEIFCCEMHVQNLHWDDCCLQNIAWVYV